jgi:hypothetical protein
MRPTGDTTKQKGYEMSISNHLKISTKTSAVIEMDNEAIETFKWLIEYAKLTIEHDESNGANRDNVKNFICHIEHYIN